MVKKKPAPVVLYVRLPRDLRDRIAKMADELAISMNLVARQAIARGLEEIEREGAS